MVNEFIDKFFQKYACKYEQITRAWISDWRIIRNRNSDHRVIESWKIDCSITENWVIREWLASKKPRVDVKMSRVSIKRVLAWVSKF